MQGVTSITSVWPVTLQAQTNGAAPDTGEEFTGGLFDEDGGDAGWEAAAPALTPKPKPRPPQQKRKQKGWCCRISMIELYDCETDVAPPRRKRLPGSCYARTPSARCHSQIASSASIVRGCAGGKAAAAPPAEPPKQPKPTLQQHCAAAGALLLGGPSAAVVPRIRLGRDWSPDTARCHVPGKTGIVDLLLRRRLPRCRAAAAAVHQAAAGRRARRQARVPAAGGCAGWCCLVYTLHTVLTWHISSKDGQTRGVYTACPQGVAALPHRQRQRRMQRSGRRPRPGKLALPHRQTRQTRRC